MCRSALVGALEISIIVEETKDLIPFRIGSEPDGLLAMTALGRISIDG